MASGDSLAEWTAVCGELATAPTASFNLINNQVLIDFDATTDEGVYFSGIMPNNYAGGGVTLLLIWTTASGTTGNCAWTAAFERQVSGAVIASDNFGTPNTVFAGAPILVNSITYTSITFTDGAQMMFLGGGERFRILITRDANHASDTMTGDARLLHVGMRET